ncbi:MAG: DUF4176 domain-containing protein [Coriobacteriales bacterium]|jgi:hypothetical protein|nr:DUF4176 domain-containing protein [Coriobacteriales bacterium]
MDIWLPIGSVVLIKGHKRLAMIFGRAQRQLSDDSQKLWDYVACPYPEGNIGPDETFLFNKEDIDRVYFIGYLPPAEYELEMQLDNIIATLMGDNGKENVVVTSDESDSWR